MSDAAQHVSDENLGKLLSENKDKLIVVDFFAVWCGPCQMAGPILEELARTYKSKGVLIAKVDVDEAPISVEKYGVRSMPTLVLFRNEVEIDRVSGFLGKNGYEKLILKHIEEK